MCTSNITNISFKNLKKLTNKVIRKHFSGNNCREDNSFLIESRTGIIVTFLIVVGGVILLIVAYFVYKSFKIFYLNKSKNHFNLFSI